MSDSPITEQESTEQETPKQHRSTQWAELRKVGKDLLSAAIKAGGMLAALRATYGKAADFYAAAETQVGWKKSTVNRLMVAAQVAAESPALVGKVTSYDSLAAFNKYDAEQRTAIAAEVGSRPDPTTINEVGKRLFPPDPEDAAERNAREAEQAAKNVALLVGKHRDMIVSTFEQVADEDHTAVLIAGARLATKIGADAPKVIAQVLAEHAAGDDSEQDQQDPQDQ